MRSLDLSPLYRTTIGFDRLAEMLDQVLAAEAGTPSYPPYNIEKIGANRYRITIAVAGFSEDELSIELAHQMLTVRGRKRDTPADEQPVYLHRGIAERAFERRFQLADHIEVTGARLEHGLLHIDLLHELPEALKPRRIPITRGKAGGYAPAGDGA